MENWAKKKKNEEEVENQFQRLPDEVVVNIFDKVSDIKILCRCFVVSKRFSSLVPLIQTVSIKSTAEDFLSMSTNFCDLELFAKLTQIRSLNLDLVSDFGPNTDTVFKWGAKFTSNLESLTLLHATSLSKMMDSEQQEDDEVIPQVGVEEFLRLATDCIKEGLFWLLILRRGILYYPMFESITISDSANKGVRLCLNGDKLVDRRNALENEIKRPGEEVVRAGSVPVLKLPKSGYVMKGVTIAHFQLCSGDDSESDGRLAMADAFVEERGVFSEAVVQILKNYKDGIQLVNALT